MQECPFWLRRNTALNHRNCPAEKAEALAEALTAAALAKAANALQLSKTATKLFLADADALCTSQDGYGFGLHRGTVASATFVGGAQLEGHGSRRVVLCQLCMEMVVLLNSREGDGRVFARYCMRRLTALEAELHSAFGRAETAMVLAGIGTLKAGAKLHGKDNDGYGF